MLREASWSRSNSFWGTFRFKRRSATLGANSGFDQPSMIALASSRILEPGAQLWKDCRRFAKNFIFRFPKMIPGIRGGSSDISGPYHSVLVLHYEPSIASLHHNESRDMSLILMPDSIGRSERAHPAGYRHDRHIGSGKPPTCLRQYRKHLLET